MYIFRLLVQKRYTRKLNAAAEGAVDSDRMENAFPVVASTDVESVHESQLREASRRNTFNARRLIVDCQLTNASCSWSAHRVPFAEWNRAFRSANTCRSVCESLAARISNIANQNTIYRSTKFGSLNPVNQKAAGCIRMSTEPLDLTRAAGQELRLNLNSSTVTCSAMFSCPTELLTTNNK